MNVKTLEYENVKVNIHYENDPLRKNIEDACVHFVKGLKEEIKKKLVKEQHEKRRILVG